MSKRTKTAPPTPPTHEAYRHDCPTCGQRMYYAYPSVHPTTIIDLALDDMQQCRNELCPDSYDVIDISTGISYEIARTEGDSSYSFHWRTWKVEGWNEITARDKATALEIWIREIRHLNPLPAEPKTDTEAL